MGGTSLARLREKESREIPSNPALVAMKRMVAARIATRTGNDACTPPISARKNTGKPRRWTILPLCRPGPCPGKAYWQCLQWDLWTSSLQVHWVAWLRKAETDIPAKTTNMTTVMITSARGARTSGLLVSSAICDIVSRPVKAMAAMAIPKRRSVGRPVIQDPFENNLRLKKNRTARVIRSAWWQDQAGERDIQD